MEGVTAPDGTHVAYTRTGHGPPLVLIHGGTSDHTRWDPILPAFRDHFTVYAVDRRGHGASGPTDAASYVMEREFDDIATLVEAIGTTVRIVGHSYGALCALRAARRTHQIRTLVLYEPPILIPPGRVIASPDTLARMQTLLEQGDREGLVLTFMREVSRRPEEEIAVMQAKPVWAHRIASAHTILYEARAVQEYVFDPQRFHSLATPTLLLLGEHSPPFLRDATGAVAAALPNSRVTVLPGQRHIAMDTAPDLFVSHVLPFLLSSN